VRASGYRVVCPYESDGSILALISSSEHSKRRRIWDRAFSPTALRTYQPLLHGRVSELVSELSARVDRPLDLAEWMSFMATDYMGDFAMGGMFSCMAHGADHAGIHALGIQLAILNETAGTLPWLRPLVVRFIKLGGIKFRELAARAIFARLENGSQTRDMFYYLVSARMCRLALSLGSRDVA
jgi:cytochrome P450